MSKGSAFSTISVLDPNDQVETCETRYLAVPNAQINSQNSASQ